MIIFINEFLGVLWKYVCKCNWNIIGFFQSPRRVRHVEFDMSDSTCRIRCTSEIHVKNKWFAIVFRGCCNSWHVQWKSVEKDIVSARTELGILCSALPGSSKNVENQTGPSTGFPARYELIQWTLHTDPKYRLGTGISDFFWKPFVFKFIHSNIVPSWFWNNCFDSMTTPNDLLFGNQAGPIN